MQEKMFYYILFAIGIMILRLPSKTKEDIIWFPFALLGNLGAAIVIFLLNKGKQFGSYLWKIIISLFKKR